MGNATGMVRRTDRARELFFNQGRMPGEDIASHVARSWARSRGAGVWTMASTPLDDVSSSFTFVIWRNDDFTVPAEDVIRLDLAIGAEDKRMLELIPGMLPLDQTSVVSVQADRCSVEWRRRLAALVGAH